MILCDVEYHRHYGSHPLTDHRGYGSAGNTEGREGKGQIDTKSLLQTGRTKNKQRVQDNIQHGTDALGKQGVHCPAGGLQQPLAHDLHKNTGGKNIYVQSATWQGKELNECKLTHSQITEGGELHFVMGDKPSEWGK